MPDVTGARRARALAGLLFRAEHALGLPLDAPGNLRERCTCILTARLGGLDVRTYRVVWWVRSHAHA